MVKSETNSEILKMKIKIVFIMLIPSLIFLQVQQMILWIFNSFSDSEGYDLGTRLNESLQGSVYGLFLAFFVIWMVILFLILRPLFEYIKTGDERFYVNARKATINLPVVNVLLIGVLWFVGLFAFFYSP